MLMQQVGVGAGA